MASDERRFEGNIGWAWIEPEATVALYQHFIYFNSEDSNWKVPEGLQVSKVVFRGEHWVVKDHDGQPKGELSS
jgi:hypothetical protein